MLTRSRMVRSVAAGARVCVTTTTWSSEQDEFAWVALRSQRKRLRDLLAAFDEDAWRVQSRCSEWTVHEVVRHLCDVTAKAAALLAGAPTEDVEASGMDPRTSPRDWLAHSRGETPDKTVHRFLEADQALLAQVAHCRVSPRDVGWVYGAVPWSIAVLHLFWDAWIHERDILLPLGEQQTSPAHEQRAAAAYGILIASLPNVALGRSFAEELVLSGSGGGWFGLEVRSGGGDARQLTMVGLPASGTVSVTAAEDVDPESASAAPLTGRLVDVVDALVGRDPELLAALAGPSERVERLSIFRNFMLAPIV